MLIDESTTAPEEPRYYPENSEVVEDPFEDLVCFLEPIRQALIARLQFTD